MSRIHTLSIAAFLTLAFTATASAQPFSNTPSYANLYSWQLGVSGQPLNPNTYLWDRYYYNNPNVSPYLNLNRAQPYGGTDYFTYVQPMEQERERQQMQSAGGPTRGGYYTAGAGGSPGSLNSSTMNSGMYHPSSSTQGQSSYGSQIMPYSTSAPNRSASYYQNHYYGGWEGRN